MNKCQIFKSEAFAISLFEKNDLGDGLVLYHMRWLDSKMAIK